MSMNRIQFQSGLSMPELLKQFVTEVQCEAALEKARWPQGGIRFRSGCLSDWRKIAATTFLSSSSLALGKTGASGRLKHMHDLRLLT